MDSNQSNLPKLSYRDTLIQFYGKYTAEELAVKQKRMQLFNGLHIFEGDPIGDKIIEALKIQDKNGVVHASGKIYSSFQAEFNAGDEVRAENKYSSLLRK